MSINFCADSRKGSRASDLQKFFSAGRLCAAICMIMAFAMVSCDSEEVEEIMPPQIQLDVEDGTYLVKCGQTLTIAPEYKYAGDAVFAWKEDGKIISTEPVLNYTCDEPGDKFVALYVINEAGETYKEMKISVMQLLPPVVLMDVTDEGFTVVQDVELLLQPKIEGGAGNVTFEWTVDGKQVATTAEYKFKQKEQGQYAVKFIATNEDGASEISFNVKVCTPEEVPFKWDFEKDIYNVSYGRTIRIKALDIKNDMGGDYTWEVAGETKKSGKETWLDIDSKSLMPAAPEKGSVKDIAVKVTMKNNFVAMSRELTVRVCPPEGTYRRSTEGTQFYEKVYEFMPAAGQFVQEQNKYFDNMQEACDWADSRMQAKGYVSLGGFGGYIVMGFDHSIVNDGDYNLQLQGNSFDGSSEPGVVWVMQDENGDGLPNDTWYELKGSADKEAIKDYSITYYKPKAPKMSVQWTDNQGNSGVVDFLNFHQQDYYYPLWCGTETLTLRGTLLPANTRETTPGYWFNGNHEWGYADNFSPIDRLTDDDNYNAGVNANHFKISNAIDFEGKPANLQYVDFVKVVTGVNCKAGWLGEISTEVFGATDFNMVRKQNIK